MRHSRSCSHPAAGDSRHGAPKPPVELRPEIGREINAVIVRCLAKTPKDRYEDAGALLHDLDQLQVGAVAA